VPKAITLARDHDSGGIGFRKQLKSCILIISGYSFFAMKRLFFALWPNETIREQLSAIEQQITAPTFRCVKPSNWHVTLSFLGNVDEDQEKQLIDYCEDINAEPFTLIFDRITCWRKPRILCLLAEPVAGVLELVSQINARADMAGIKTENRPYLPHITLARKASHNIPLVFEKINWTARDFCLVESVSQQSGVQYQVLRRWRLKNH
jgi:2'-5' RNA ligase